MGICMGMAWKYGALMGKSSEGCHGDMHGDAMEVGALRGKSSGGGHGDTYRAGGGGGRRRKEERRRRSRRRDLTLKSNDPTQSGGEQSNISNKSRIVCVFAEPISIQVVSRLS